MDLGWQLDNPAIALAKYYEDVESFAKKKAENGVLEDELSARQSELNSQNSELSGLKGRLSSMGTYEKGDVDGAVQEVVESSKKKIDGETKKAETKTSELSAKRDRDIQENDNWLKNKLAQLLGDNADADRELTEAEKKALEFEIARRQFLAESNERINEFEVSSTEEQLACQTVVGDLKSKQDAIYARFEPDIGKFKKQIEAINKKYQPDIRSCQSIVSEKVSDRDEEIGRLQTERNREIQLANNEIDGYQREFKQTEKQFNEQIRMAKLQSKPTTRMENSKVSRLNAINDNIQKINNRVNKKVSSIDQKIEVAQSKHAKIIEKAESQLEAVIRNRDQELSGPTKTYNGLVQDRDGQIATLQSKIDQRQNECDSKISQYKSKIEAERQSQNDNNTKIDQQIVDFVMSGDTCFSDVLNEQNAPFVALQGRIQNWMEMLSCIKKDKLSSCYQSEHDKQKSILISKNYQELQTELSEATQYNDQLSIFAKNNMLLMILGGALTVLGIVLFVVLDIVLKNSVGMIGIISIILGIAMVVLTVLKTQKEFSKICKYVSLASDYQEFPSLTSQSTKITQDRELAKMKSMGEKLYDAHYGRTEAQKIHDAKDVDIKSDYERNLKLLKKEFDNYRAQVERERDAEIKRIKDESIDGEANFNSEKDDLQSQISPLTERIQSTNKRINELKEKIDSNSRFMEAFEDAYSILVKQLDNEEWQVPNTYANGILNDSFYIIPANGEMDGCNHRKIYRVNHNKKAIVVNYDISDVDDTKADDINKIIRNLMFDLMDSVRRISNKEFYAQFVVDGNGATDELKNGDTKRKYAIDKVVAEIDSLKGEIDFLTKQKNEMDEKGITADEFNKTRTSFEKPLVYCIMYFVFRPKERTSRLDDKIRLLCTGCEKYGFLPVFICEKDIWERESQEKESIYKDIKELANSEILVFDGKTYSVAY